MSLLSLVEGGARLIPTRGRALDLATYDAALDAAGADAYWGDDLEVPLRMLLDSYRTEASLSALGRLGVGWDVGRFLGNLARFREEEARAPEIAGERIEAPVVITGLPRSGSTFLHGLLAEDPANQVLRCWQAIYPYPAPGRHGDSRPRRVDRDVRIFALLNPGIRSIYPLDGWSPQECTEVTAHVFQSLRFDGTHHVPAYRKWLDGHGHLTAYRFHKRFLQHMQHQGAARRWILKSPDHVFALDALRSVYPDARVVFLHRDPLKVLPSVAQLTETLRIPFTRRVDRRKIGEQVTAHWRTGAVEMIKAVRDGSFPASRLIHVNYRDLVARPLETVGDIYRHFGMRLGSEAVERMSRRVAAKPNGGYGRNVYRFETHGIDPDRIRQDFDAYMNTFDVPREAADLPLRSPDPCPSFGLPSPRRARS